MSARSPSSSPASRTIVLKPTVHQRVASRIENHAHGFVVSHVGETIPQLERKFVSSPKLPLKIHHQSSPTTAIPSVHGTKKIARKAFRPRYLPLTTIARKSPPITSIGVLRSTKMTVFQSPFQKTGKW